MFNDTLVFLVVVFIYALAENLQVMGRWIERPYLFFFPAVATVLAVVVAASVRRRRDRWPFAMVALSVGDTANLRRQLSTIIHRGARGLAKVREGVGALTSHARLRGPSRIATVTISRRSEVEA